MSEEFTEENILLAGQISNTHPIFKTIAQMDHDSALIYHLLQLLPKIENENDDVFLQEVIKLNGQVNFMTSCSELSKLAAIMGDTRRRFSAKKLREVIDNAKRANPEL